MERESFEDHEVAALLNQNFVSIKVDREERPDIDAVYMNVCQALTGSGGWPLTVFLTQDEEPFYAGTYFPKKGRPGLPGLMELLKEVASLWAKDKKKLLRSGKEIAQFAAKREEEAAAAPSPLLLHTAFEQLQSRYDPIHGGFGSAPKFPSAHNLLFLMGYAATQNNEEAFDMAATTLRCMSGGGIFDHIGGGFSRYSTDREWLAPHFEKMLYDNAFLIHAYLEAYLSDSKEEGRAVVEQTLSYIKSTLTHPEGGFYCGQDADSDGVEGKFYLFTPEEIHTVLGQTDGDLFCKAYDITPEGNFEGKSIPNRLYPKAPVPENREALCETLRTYREKRTSLLTDDKILTSWNGMMVSAFAKAYRVLGKDEYLTTARKAVGFLQEKLIAKDWSLFLRWRDGEAAIDGQLDDYAFYSLGLIELYEADFDPAHLKEAVRLANKMLERFEDPVNGGFFLYASDNAPLISRPKELYDGAAPSGNSAAALLLVLLAALTGETVWSDRAQRQLSYLAGNIKDDPAGHGYALLAFLQWLCPAGELVCVLPNETPPDGLRELACRNHLSVLVKTPKTAEALARVAPFTSGYPIPEQGTDYYFCQNHACSPVMHDFAKLSAWVADHSPSKIK